MNQGWKPPKTYFYGPRVSTGDAESLAYDFSRLNLGDWQETYPVNKFVLEEGMMDLARLNKLKSLLLQNPYPDEEQDGDCQKLSETLYTWGDLKTIFSATDEELFVALNMLSASEIDGHWRLVHYTYMDRLLNTLLSTASEQHWSLSSLDIYKVVSALVDTGYSKDDVCHCLALFANTTDGRFWELYTERVSVQFALHTLCYYKKMTVEAFLRNWANCGLPVGLDLVAGEIVLQKVGTEYWVSLPPDRYGPNLTPVYHEVP